MRFSTWWTNGISLAWRTKFSPSLCVDVREGIGAMRED